MTNGCETWSPSNTQLDIPKGKMERIMVEVTLEDRKSINWIQKQWCDRHYQEHKRKQTQMSGTHGKEK